ncbi:MAG: biliverdin-producing heme oxygenase [Microthrixaceae bacterium]|nr:biliverdin-producing heme oxygenase [Microthrixaceae bacterium]
MNTTTTAPSPTRVPFSQTIRESTTTDHRDAERSPFMAALFERSASLSAYTALVQQQYLVYEVLEAASEHMASDPVAGRFVHQELLRVPSLEADLAVLVGEHWRGRLEPTDATLAYTERLRQVCFDWPGGFVAHHYTRYMGDLSGGQFIGRSVREQFGLSDAGASFYRFEGIADPGAFKERYRRELDAVPWDDSESARVVDEVHRAYQHNAELLASIG